MENKLFRPLQYDVDIVFCLDMTCRMQGLENIKRGLRKFYCEYNERYEEACKEIENFRIRFLLFRDYKCDAEPMVQSPFFTLDGEMEEALAWAQGCEPGGGGDMPENSLEALSLAMDSEWNTENDRRRQIIVLVTDSTPHPLGECADCPAYPDNMPKDLDELREKWDSLGRRKRLYLFAPNEKEWLQMSEWNNVFFCAVEFGCNCVDVDVLSMLTEVIY